MQYSLCHLQLCDQNFINVLVLIIFKCIVLYPQIQSVGSQLVLDPLTVCEDLHFCFSNGPTDESPSNGEHSGLVASLSKDSATRTTSDVKREMFSAGGTKTSSLNIVNFVQLADIHLDPLYSEVSVRDILIPLSVVV